MMKIRGMLAAGMSMLALAAAAQSAAEIKVAKWKGDAKACFLLAFDDGCPSQMKNVIPMLDKYKLPGTFYIFPEGGHFAWQKDKWAKAAESPYIFLGNHTIDHKDILKAADFEPSLLKCAAVLKEMTPNEKWPRLVSFAVPGVKTWNITKEEVAQVLKRHHHVERPDYHGPPFFRGKTEEALKLIDETIASGGIEHLDFHGVGGDWLSAPTEYLEAVCKKLDSSRKDVWTAAAEQYNKYEAERAAAKIERPTLTKTSASFTLSVPGLDAQIYDFPLTVVVPAAGWTSAKVTVGKGKSVVVPVVDGKVLVEVLAGPVRVEKIK